MKMSAGMASLVLTGVLATGALGQGLIVDHTCTDLDKVPVQAIEKAKAAFKVAYGHTSHGSQVVSGMQALAKAKPDLFGFGEGGGQKLAFLDYFAGGDLGGNWAQATRDFLNGRGKNQNVNAIMWSWCGQVSGASEEYIEKYLRNMTDLERDFPKIKFVYMTGHLDGSGTDGNLNKRNEQIREYCRKNGKVLFDFADIESYDPDGKVNYMALHATDSCNYRDGGVTKNWADEWLAKHPGEIALPSSAAHTRPLNGALKGRAFWWMMARLAGWEPATN